MLKVNSKGVSLPQNKKTAVTGEISVLPVPPVLNIPLARSESDKIKIKAQPGMHVKRYSLLSVPKKSSCVPSSAPVAGDIAGIRLADHPVLGRVPFAVMNVTGRNRPPKIRQEDVSVYESDDIINIALSAAIIDEYDSTPLFMKLRQAAEGNFNIIYADALDDEPYVSSSLKLMLSESELLSTGIRLAQKATGIKNAAVAACMPHGVKQKKLPDIGGVKVEWVDLNYPAAKRFYKAAGEESVIIGTAALVWLARAAFCLVPCNSSIVSVGGTAMKKTFNFSVVHGTPVQFLLDFLKIDPDSVTVVLGGSMTGVLCEDMQTPIIAGIKAVIVNERTRFYENPCNNCGICATHCPSQLLPVNIIRAYEGMDHEKISFYGAEECIGCGVCSYLCPEGCDVSGKIGQAREYLAQYNEYMQEYLREKEAAKAKKELQRFFKPIHRRDKSKAEKKGDENE